MHEGKAADWWLGIAGVVTLVAAWELAVRMKLLSPLAFPEPFAVARALAALVVDPTFLAQAGDTMTAWLVVMLLAVTFTVPIGLLMGYISALYRPASTVVHAARSVPATSLIPVAILLFGLGTPMKVAVAFYAIAWPLILNTMYGVHAVEGQLMTTGRSFGWGRGKLLARVILPSAAPSIATGVRIAGSVALLLMVSAEILGARRGIGTVLTLYQEAHKLDFVYAGIVIVGLLGMVIFYALTALERAATPWAHANRRS
jgi:ABC-type nitrate/sulfonate/bicarbonate transport system permease component